MRKEQVYCDKCGKQFEAKPTASVDQTIYGVEVCAPSFSKFTFDWCKECVTTTFGIVPHPDHDKPRLPLDQLLYGIPPDPKAPQGVA